MKIRIGNKNDAAGIAKVHIDTWKACYKNIVPDSYLESFDYSKRTKGWKKELTHNSHLNFVVESKNEIIGWLTCGTNRDKRSDDILEIYGIYILPKYWGDAVGLSLFNTAMKSLEKEEPKIITLWVLKDNLRAIKFYQNNGFTFDGTSKLINIGGTELIDLRYEKVYS